METKGPPPYQRRGIVYYHAMVIGDASYTKVSQPPLQESAATEAPKSGVGISDKELDELAKIVDKLGIDSTLFEGPDVAHIAAIYRGKKLIEPMLIAGIEPGSSSKGVYGDLSEQNKLSMGGIETESACIVVDKIQEHDVLLTDLVPRSLAKVAVLDDPDAGGVKLVDPRKVVTPVLVAPKVLHEGADLHKVAAPFPQETKQLYGGVDTLSEGVVRKGSSSHRHKSLPPMEGSKVDAEEAAHSNKRSRHEKHHPSSSTKRSLSRNDLVDATK
ncbi:hypothetical protein V6N13_110975 [Hibiscus sabdariffa]